MIGLWNRTTCSASARAWILTASYWESVRSNCLATHAMQASKRAWLNGWSS